MEIFLPPCDPRLNEPSAEIALHEIASKETQGLIDQMYKIAAGERNEPEKRGMVGLAAPQIGVFKRVILVDIGVDTKRRAWGELRAYINPRIIHQSDEVALDREGCFSVDDHVCGLVPRSKQITIAAFDRDGSPVEETFFDYTARIFQHEIDHLDGKRFPDRVGQTGVLHWVELNEYPDYRQQWKNWPRLFSWDNWIRMKEGQTYSMSPE